MIFGFSFLGVIFYGLLRVCIIAVQGYFVEKCNNPNNSCKDNIDSFSGELPFNLSESMILTFIKYTLSYYLLYTILIIFPITHKSFGLNSIVPFLVGATICYIGIYKSTHIIKENIKLTPDDYGFKQGNKDTTDYSEETSKSSDVKLGKIKSDKVKTTQIEKWLNDNPSYGQVIYSWLYKLFNKTKLKE